MEITLKIAKLAISRPSESLEKKEEKRGRNRHQEIEIIPWNNLKLTTTQFIQSDLVFFFSVDVTCFLSIRQSEVGVQQTELVARITDKNLWSGKLIELLDCDCQ